MARPSFTLSGVLMPKGKPYSKTAKKAASMQTNNKKKNGRKR